MFKGLTGLASLVRHAHELPSKMAAIQRTLRERRVEGASHQGRVRVTLDGTGEVLQVEIHPELMNPEDPEPLEQSISAALNEALGKAKALHVEAMRGETEKMDLDFPGLQQAFDQLSGVPGKAARDG